MNMLRRRLRTVVNTARVYPFVWSARYRKSIEVARAAVQHGALQKMAELAPLLALLQSRELKTVVEIGSARGGTFYAWCQVAAPNATVVSIDLPGGRFGGGYTEADTERFRTFGQPDQNLVFIRADSQLEQTRDELLRVVDGQSIDFLMIDGDHTEAGVWRDFELYAPLVSPGGLIALHDILPHPPGSDCHVDTVWSDLKERYRSIEFVHPAEDWGYGQWGGIGVLVCDTHR